MKEKVKNIKISNISDFPKHPSKINNKSNVQNETNQSKSTINNDYKKK